MNRLLARRLEGVFLLIGAIATECRLEPGLLEDLGKVMEILQIEPVFGMVLRDDQDFLWSGAAENRCHFADLFFENPRSATEIDLANVVEAGRKQVAIDRSDLVARVPEIDRAIKCRRSLAEARLEPIRDLTPFFEYGVSDLIF